MARSLALRSVLLSICAAAFACGGGRTADCATSSDCPAPQSCISGHCVSSGCAASSSACSANADCAAGRHCAQGCCQQGATTSCAADQDCAAKPDTPLCDTTSGACVACLKSSDCGPGKLCQRDACVAQPGCASSKDCTDKTLRICLVSQRACVECIAGSDCLDPARPVCDASHRCVAPALCRSGADCAKPTPVCDTSSGNCVGCLKPSDCPASFTCSPQHTCTLQGNGTCATDSDCAGNASTPHCKVDSSGAGACVACLDTTQCPAGQVCAGDNTCQTKQCASDANCAATPSTPRCDLVQTPHACVACLADADCPNGGVCQADRTCKAYVGPCRGDADCSADLQHPHCKAIAGGANQCVECLSAADCGTGRTCSAQNTCQAVPTCTQDQDCAATPKTPHCLQGSGSTPSACVQCVTSAQCGAGFKCTAQNVCAPVCTVATQAKDCAQPTPVCKESPSGNACVQCVQGADCAPGQICSSANTCIAKPPACDSPPKCTSSGNCCPAGTVCNTVATPRACVQCLGNADCTNGYVCDTSSNTCKPPPVGAEGQPCAPGGTCNTGLLCINEGPSPGGICRAQCNPYASGNPCVGTPGKVCEWIAFDSGGKLFGFCAAPNAHGRVGAACDPRVVDSCEWNLLCAPTGVATGTCAQLCDPKAPSCGSGACNAFVGALDASHAAELIGYCGPPSTWGRACVGDSGAAGPDCGSPLANSTPQSLYCAPSQLLAENPSINVIATCQFRPAASSATGGAATDCSALGGDACRTAICLADGPVSCFAGCATTSDCARDEDDPTVCPSGGCSLANPTYCMDYPFSTPAVTSRVPTCVPRCRNESDCAAVAADSFARTCVAQGTHAGSSWQTYCSPVQGSARAGAKCAGNGDCESGVCLTGAALLSIELGQTVPGFTATDGICLGSCLPPSTCTSEGASCTTADTRAGTCSGGLCRALCGGSNPSCTLGDRCVNGLCEMDECGSPNGTRCDGYTALPLAPADTGDLGVVGYPRYGVCVGNTCGRDADCAGFSRDANAPRVCTPYKRTTTSSNATNRSKACTTDSQCIGSPYTGVCNTAANNPNPNGAYGTKSGIYGPNGTCRTVTWALQCAPSLGPTRKPGGASCAHGVECQSGQCLSSNGGPGFCFGACQTTSDCGASGTTCRAINYLGIANLHSCQP